MKKERGQTRSSEKALSFARRFLDDELERKRLQAEINAAEEEPVGLSASNRHETSAEAAKSSPLQVMSNTDYGKYERLSKKLDEEEERRRRQEEAQAAAAREMMQGCSHDHSKERQIYEKPTGEKIVAADRFRQEGNAAFREKNYGLAAVNYRKALLQFDYTFPDTDEEQKRMDSVKLPCHLNLAACKLQQQDFDEVYIQCRLALEMDPTNVKAHYRRGLAYLQQDHFVEAKEDLMKAHEQEPGNREVRDALLLLREKIQRYKRRSAKTYKAMLRSDEREETPKAVAASAASRGEPAELGAASKALSGNQEHSRKDSASHTPCSSCKAAPRDRDAAAQAEDRAPEETPSARSEASPGRSPKRSGSSCCAADSKSDAEEMPTRETSPPRGREDSGADQAARKGGGVRTPSGSKEDLSIGKRAEAEAGGRRSTERHALRGRCGETRQATKRGVASSGPAWVESGKGGDIAEESCLPASESASIVRETRSAGGASRSGTRSRPGEAFERPRQPETPREDLCRLQRSVSFEVASVEEADRRVVQAAQRLDARALLQQKKQVHERLLRLLKEKQQTLRKALERKIAEAGGDSDGRASSVASSPTVSSGRSSREDAFSDDELSPEGGRGEESSQPASIAESFGPVPVQVLCVIASAFLVAFVGFLIALAGGFSGRAGARSRPAEPPFASESFRADCDAGLCAQAGESAPREARARSPPPESGEKDAAQSALDSVANVAVVVAGGTTLLCLAVAALVFFLDSSRGGAKAGRRQGRRGAGSPRRRPNRPTESAGRGREHQDSDSEEEDAREWGGSGALLDYQEASGSEESDALEAAGTRESAESAHRQPAGLRGHVSPGNRGLGSRRRSVELHEDPTYDSVMRQWCS
ncbi:tetratricopeptide repeat-containing protein [Besnoitia besnoiti]|uniref:Tetratricopeptide repeat-containing protein n=1 Tax=Besnoitia besnoiti TaxID=94643 RepID=A0A2A9MBX0_BESBE|nr:tetratricopeptide repeat-containing protein [Besnoitia besnoiti]PFH33117.1 tetratricopeptide repeat-containing protein [Besnoitia besnoiti]